MKIIAKWSNDEALKSNWNAQRESLKIREKLSSSITIVQNKYLRKRREKTGENEFNIKIMWSSDRVRGLCSEDPTVHLISQIICRLNDGITSLWNHRFYWQRSELSGDPPKNGPQQWTFHRSSFEKARRKETRDNRCTYVERTAELLTAKLLRKKKAENDIYF